MPPEQREEASCCSWAQSADDYIKYHDEEWGVPVYSDLKMFEHLLLETFQAGLSWLLILRRREAFRAAFHSFDPQQIAKMTSADVDRLTQDASIVRNRAKIQAAIDNARAVVAMRETEHVGLAEYFWRAVGFVPVQTRPAAMADVPCTTPVAERLSRDLKRRGFRFVGPTVIYAHLQSTGIVNDHVVRCPRSQAVQRLVRTQQEWKQAGVDVGVMGDSAAFWEKIDRDAAKAGSRKSAARKRKARAPPPLNRSDASRNADVESAGRRRSRRLAARVP